jgi:AcrR family transcriptional regulator
MAREVDMAVDAAMASEPLKARGQPPSAARAGSSTERKIMLGAIAALGRHGSQSLSMSDVALAANVSRATLYRYFPTKAQVLEAVSEYISASFIRGADAIARDVRDPLERLKAIMALQLKLATEEFIRRITEVEPSLVLKFLTDHYEPHVEAIQRVLDPLYDQLEKATGFRLDREILAASILRMQLSLVIVPPDERWRSSPEVLANMLAAVLSASGTPASKRTGRRKSR